MSRSPRADRSAGVERASPIAPRAMAASRRTRGLGLSRRRASAGAARGSRRMPDERAAWLASTRFSLAIIVRIATACSGRIDRVERPEAVESSPHDLSIGKPSVLVLDASLGIRGSLDRSIEKHPAERAFRFTRMGREPALRLPTDRKRRVTEVLESGGQVEAFEPPRRLTVKGIRVSQSEETPRPWTVGEKPVEGPVDEIQATPLVANRQREGPKVAVRPLPDEEFPGLDLVGRTRSLDLVASDGSQAPITEE